MVTRPQLTDRATRIFLYNLTRLMADRDVTQAELSRRLNVNQSQICRLLSSGRDVRISTLSRLARVLGCDMVDFLEEIPPIRR